VRIAYYSPLPPQRTGIADYSADLLPELAGVADLTLFADEPSKVLPEFGARYELRPAAKLPGLRWSYDMVVYQIGNSLFHRDILRMACRYPGLAVLHDETLHHLISTITAGEGGFPAYVRELAYAKGVEGADRAREINAGAETPLFSWTLNNRLVDLSLGTLVHSRSVQRRLLSGHPQSQIGYVSQAMPLPAQRDRSDVRRRLGIPVDTFVIVTCGGVTPEKRLDLVTEAFLKLRAEYGKAYWVVVGASAAGGQLWYDRIVRAGAETSTLVLGYLEDMQAFSDAIATADVCVNLRDPSAGETSASALRALALGVPVVASDAGWYRELPDTICARIRHDGTEVSQMVNALASWHLDPGSCRAAGEAGRLFVAEQHDPRRSAGVYVAFIEKILGNVEMTYG